MRTKNIRNATIVRGDSATIVLSESGVSISYDDILISCTKCKQKG